MILKKIILKNFRQFYGEQELTISCDPEKNVTLIHAENGVGKTTILNAILWCFYKETTARFEQPEKIANYQAVSEDSFQVKVEVLFEHEGNDYIVSRELDERTGEESFKAFMVSRGNFTPLDAPNTFVDSVVPKEMARYFFFDGEYAETFSSQNNKAKVKEALENMLGCRIAIQAIKDLNSLQTEHEKQIAALTKNNQASAFQERIDSLEAENNKEQAELIVCENNLDAAKSARAEIIEKLRGAVGASEIQKRRESLEAQRDQILEQRKRLEADLATWINDGGLGLISKKLEEKTQKMLEDEKLKGKIPSYIAETFVVDILQKKQCICGRGFEDGSAEHRHISSLLADAGTAVATDRLMLARSLMGSLSELRRKALPDLEKIKISIEACGRDINTIEAKIEDCRTQLRDDKNMEVAEREAALERRNHEIDELNAKISRIRFATEERTKVIEENKKKRDKMLQTNKKAAALQKRCALLAQTVQRIEVELTKYREESRTAIGKDVNEILDRTARRNYFATIDDKFSLDMFYKETNTSVPRSGGENQLLSLAFIASLIKFGADRIESGSEILKPGTSAPLVLDSPFGQLDPSYQKSTASFLPTMAKQVILLLTRTQGNAEVMNILREKIGKEHVLVSENAGAQGDKPSDVLNINGQEIASSLYEREKTFTRIQSL